MSSPRKRGPILRAPSIWERCSTTFCYHELRWLWVPTFAGTTNSCSHLARHRVETIDDEVALGLVDPYRHVIAAAVQFLVEDFRIAMQPADTGAVGCVDREIKRHARRGQPLFDRAEQRVDPLPGFGRNQEN